MATIIKKLTKEERIRRVLLASEIIDEAIKTNKTFTELSKDRNLSKDYISQTFDLIEGMNRMEVPAELIKNLENLYDEYYERPVVLEGIPIPERKKALERMSKYKFNELTTVGKCAVIPIKNDKQFKAICSYASNYAKNRGWKFTARQLGENKIGVWRVEKPIKNQIIEE